MIPTFTDYLAAAVANRYDPDEDTWTTWTVKVETGETAKFLGELMSSALQSRTLTEAIDAGTLHVWAIVIGNQLYGIGANSDADGRLTRFHRSFTCFNRPDDRLVELDELFDKLAARADVGFVVAV